jgi:hypothetical protein
MAPMTEKIRFQIENVGAINTPLLPRHLLLPICHLCLRVCISNGWSPLWVHQLGCPRRR